MRFAILFSLLFAFSAQAGIEYGTDVRDLKVCGMMTAGQVSYEDTFAMSVPVYSVTTRVVRTPIYTCESSDGTGKGDWKGFYDQAGDKANQLNAAILGVGKSVAPGLVPFFQRNKPRSWSEFAARIEEGASAVERSTGTPRSAWVPQVLYRYKQENMENLGYFDRTNCRITGYDTQTVVEREQISTARSVMHATVIGGLLLPNECDSVSVVFRGTSYETRGNASGNTYRVELTYSDISHAEATFVGTRNAIRPSNLVEGRRSSARLVGNVMQAVLVHPATIVNAVHPAYAAACKAEATVVVQGMKKGVWGSKRVALATQVFPIEMGAEQTSVSVSGVQLDPKQNLAVQVTTNYVPGCPFFSAELSGKQDLTILK